MNSPAGTLLVNEVFTSFQGEGLHTGLRTTFIRLAGCNLDCSWCDTRYARAPDSGTSTPIGELISGVRSEGTKLVCITGGEPLLQKGIGDLIGGLLGIGVGVDIETNGSLPLRDHVSDHPSVFLSVDVKTPSSGESGSFLIENLDLLRPSDQLKFIVRDEADISFMSGFVRSNRPCCTVVVTPVSNGSGERIGKHLGKELASGGLFAFQDRVRLMVQSHKVLFDDERGV